MFGNMFCSQLVHTVHNVHLFAINTLFLHQLCTFDLQVTKQKLKQTQPNKNKKKKKRENEQKLNQLVSVCLWILQDRTSEYKTKRWNCKSCWNSFLCCWSLSDYSIQGSNHIQPNSSITQYQFYYNTTSISITWRCQRQKLDFGLHVSNWTLLDLVCLAGLTGSCFKEVSSQTLCYFIYLFLWTHTVLDHCCCF